MDNKTLVGFRTQNMYVKFLCASFLYPSADFITANNKFICIIRRMSTNAYISFQLVDVTKHSIRLKFALKLYISIVHQIGNFCGNGSFFGGGKMEKSSFEL